MTQKHIGFNTPNAVNTNNSTEQQSRPTQMKGVQHANPDPRIQGFMRMVLSEDFMVMMNAKSIEVGNSRIGSLSFNVGNDGYIHLQYRPPTPEEPIITLFAGCMIPPEQGGDSTGGEGPPQQHEPINAVAQYQYNPYFQ